MRGHSCGAVPVPKSVILTRVGEGATGDYEAGLDFRAAVANAGRVPITIKIRKGIDDRHLTYLDAGRIAEEEGASAVMLHGRTAFELYSGEADWSAIYEITRREAGLP